MKVLIGLIMIEVVMLVAGCTTSTTVYLQNGTNADETAVLEVGRDHKKYMVGTIPPGGQGSCKLEWLWDTGFPTNCVIKSNNQYRMVKLDDYRNGINNVDMYFRITESGIIGPTFSEPKPPVADYPAGGDASPVRNYNGPGPENLPANPPAAE